MAPFDRMIRFEAEDGKIYVADLGPSRLEPYPAGASVDAHLSFDDLIANRNKQSQVKLKRILAPLPRPEIPIYCVGLNFKSHLVEVENAKISKHPPLWTKPALSLADPGEDIPINALQASSLPDYEGELVFVTSRECRDITAEEASSYILGYTIGNDISCRLFQLPEMAGGQFYFAKAFDKFAPIGPVLVSSEAFGSTLDGGIRLTTRLGDKVVQEVSDLKEDMIWDPYAILSWMSQGTTIPAGTAVMTGTPAGVGVFQSPRRMLQDGDVVEVEISKLGVLRNKIRFT